MRGVKTVPDGESTTVSTAPKLPPAGRADAWNSQGPVLVSSQLATAAPLSLMATQGSSTLPPEFSCLGVPKPPPGGLIAAWIVLSCFQTATASPPLFIASLICPVQNAIGPARGCGALNEPPGGRAAH